MNNITKIVWNLSNHCKSACSYCPPSIHGGPRPKPTEDYIRIANLLISNYTELGRTIDWTFDGGEPLDMENIVTLIKLCRENGKSMTLHTNGGRLWLDWWALEPYVDTLNLTFHYWQNKALIYYIMDTFIKKDKMVNLSVPIRPDFFDYDINTALEVEIKYGIVVSKSILYKKARKEEGQFEYTHEQLAIMSGTIPAKPNTQPVIQKVIATAPLVKEKEDFIQTTWQERHDMKFRGSPSFTNKQCNAGIEYLNISHDGWALGSNCKNQPLGNIWSDSWNPPTSSQTCTMQACVDPQDRLITKF